MATQMGSQPTAGDTLSNIFKEVNVYADPWTLPEGAFDDLYHLLDPLCEPASHTQVDGRRGTGKTVLMVQAYLRTLRQFEATKDQPPYQLAVYIDLSQDVSASDRDPAPVRALQIYRQILKLILTASHRQGNRRGRRFWGLKDYLDDRPGWFRRIVSRFYVERYQSYIESFGDQIAREVEFVQESKWRDVTRGKVGISTEQDRKGFPFTGEYDVEAQEAEEMETRLTRVYQRFGGKVRSYLEAVLESMQVEHLILFLDEWSGHSVGTEVQPFLYEQLTETFPAGGRVVLKLATIPGTTRLSFSRNPVKIIPIAVNQIQVERTALTRALLLNLNAVPGSRFPADRYLTAEQAQEGYPLFLNDVFEKDAAAIFFDASENIPRQMLMIFNSIYRLWRYAPNPRISPQLVKLAVKDHFKNIQDHLIHQDPVLNPLVARLLEAGSRVVDIERCGHLLPALDFLVDEGVIFRCEGRGRKGYQRFFLSYPAELYRLYHARTARSGSEIEIIRKISVDPTINCTSARTTPRVIISDIGLNRPG